MTRRMVQRGAFLLLAAVMALGAARLPTSPQRDTANEVYVYNGYAAATDAPWDEKSLELAAHRFQHLIDTYFTDGGYHFYLSVVPDKAQFTQPPEGYAPAGAADTADWLAGCRCRRWTSRPCWRWRTTTAPTCTGGRSVCCRWPKDWRRH